MKSLSSLLLMLCTCFFIGCASTKNERISQNQALFNTYTPGERHMIRTGQVAIGFDQDMVRMSLGDPSNETTIDSAGGKQVVWEYREIDPSLGLNLGGAIRTSGSGVGIGSGVNVNPHRTKLLKRIVFDRQTGRVSKIESYD